LILSACSEVGFENNLSACQVPDKLSARARQEYSVMGPLKAHFILQSSAAEDR